MGNKGSKNGCAKLTEEDVLAMRDIARTMPVSRYREGRCRILAEMFGVSVSLVEQILRGKRWTHVRRAEAKR